MNFFKKISLFIVIIFVFISAAPSAFCVTKIAKKEFETQTKDAHIIKATLTYPKIEGKTKYPTVVLLHSLGYSSEDWGNFIIDLNNAGYAVIAIDLRGHGKSVYNTNLQQKSWVYFTNKAYQKFPNDVVAVLQQAQTTSKKVSLDNMAFVGADIGTNTAILASKTLAKKPKALVLISPTLNFKGLFVPITLTEIGTIPVLAMASKQDGFSMQAEQKLAKFAQGAFYVKNYPTGGMGMMMLKTNPTMSNDIIKWLKTVLK